MSVSRRVLLKALFSRNPGSVLEADAKKRVAGLSPSDLQVGYRYAQSMVGSLGLLGPAGSGASVWKSNMTSTAPPGINLTLNLEGQPFRQIRLDQNDKLVEELLRQHDEDDDDGSAKVSA